MDLKYATLAVTMYYVVTAKTYPFRTHCCALRSDVYVKGGNTHTPDRSREHLYVCPPAASLV